MKRRSEMKKRIAFIEAENEKLKLARRRNG